LNKNLVPSIFYFSFYGFTTYQKPIVLKTYEKEQNRLLKVGTSQIFKHQLLLL